MNSNGNDYEWHWIEIEGLPDDKTMEVYWVLIEEFLEKNAPNYTYGWDLNGKRTIDLRRSTVSYIPTTRRWCVRDDSDDSITPWIPAFGNSKKDREAEKVWACKYGYRIVAWQKVKFPELPKKLMKMR